jgi:hypothetical protein
MFWVTCRRCIQPSGKYQFTAITTTILEPRIKQTRTPCKKALDLAKLSQNLLKGEALTAFVNVVLK